MQWLVFLFDNISCAEKNNFKDGYKAESHTESHEATHIGNEVDIAGLNIANIFHYKRLLEVNVSGYNSVSRFFLRKTKNGQPECKHSS